MHTRAVGRGPAPEDAERAARAATRAPTGSQSRLLPGAVLAFQSATFSGRTRGLRTGLLGWGLSWGERASPPAPALPPRAPTLPPCSRAVEPRLKLALLGCPLSEGVPGSPGREEQGAPGDRPGKLENWSHL